jgi:Secretion system C-terminal sorting domain
LQQEKSLFLLQLIIFINMKNLFFILILLVKFILVAQNHDHSIVTGSDYLGLIDPKLGLNVYHLNTNGSWDTTCVSNTGSTFTLSGSSDMSDSLGNLQYFTNGGYIFNQNYDTIPNSYIGYGVLMNDVVGCPSPNSSFSIPSDQKGVYYLFHQCVTYVGNEPICDKIFRTKIDMNASNGIILENSYEVLSQPVLPYHLTACKHANGRDWWILAPKFQSDIVYKILVTADGQYQVDSMRITDTYHNLLGYGKFSNDGTKYIRSVDDGSIPTYDDNEGFYVYPFNRCTGNLDKPSFVQQDSSFRMAISTSGRFIYISTFWNIYQFDLVANSIKDSRKEVYKYSTNYGGGADINLQANGQIWTCGGTSANPYIDMIPYPDLEAPLCGYIVGSEQCKDFSVNSIPHFPNYRLGPLYGSGCDTLTSVAEPVAGVGVRVFPNPANTQFQLETTHPLLNFQVWNLTGSLVLTQLGSTEINTSTWSEGLYLYKALDEKGNVFTGKIIVQHP